MHFSPWLINDENIAEDLWEHILHCPLPFFMYSLGSMRVLVVRVLTVNALPSQNNHGNFVRETLGMDLIYFPFKPQLFFLHFHTVSLQSNMICMNITFVNILSSWSQFENVRIHKNSLMYRTRWKHISVSCLIGIRFGCDVLVSSTVMIWWFEKYHIPHAFQCSG